MFSFSQASNPISESAGWKNLPTPTPADQSCKAFCTGVPVKRMRQLDFSPRRLLAKREDMFFILAAGNTDTPAPILWLDMDACSVPYACLNCKSQEKTFASKFAWNRQTHSHLEYISPSIRKADCHTIAILSKPDSNRLHSAQCTCAPHHK